MSKVRMVLVWGVLAGGLGCSGIGQKLMELSGSEIKIGADATVPADFPMPAPDGGTLVTSALVNVAGMKTTTVQYAITGDTAAILAVYEQKMKDAGLTTSQRSDANGEMVNGQGAGTSQWSAVVSDQDGKKILTLLVIEAAGGT